MQKHDHVIHNNDANTRNFTSPNITSHCDLMQTILRPYPQQIAVAAHFGQNLIDLLPPLRSREGARFQYPQVQVSEQADERSDPKERNRIAAQKWRQKKDHYLAKLEESNDHLRRQALDLLSHLQTLKVENNVLENELVFFQQFMSKMMNAPR